MINTEAGARPSADEKQPVRKELQHKELGEAVTIYLQVAKTIGAVGASAVFSSNNRTRVEIIAKFHDRTSSSEALRRIITFGIKLAQKMGVQVELIRTDLQQSMPQLLNETAKQSSFIAVELITREENQRADQLAKIAAESRQLNEGLQLLALAKHIF